METHPVQTYQGAQKVYPQGETIHTIDMPEDMSPKAPKSLRSVYIPSLSHTSAGILSAGTKHSLKLGIIEANKGKHVYIMRPRCP